MKLKEGQLAVLKKDSQQYTGLYAGTDVRILTLDNEVYCTVEAFDGKKFSCPMTYIVSYNDFYNPPNTSSLCECGAKYSNNPHYHQDYCPLYKERK